MTKSCFVAGFAVVFLVAGCSDNESALPAPSSAPAPSATAVAQPGGAAPVAPPPVGAPPVAGGETTAAPAAAQAAQSSGPGLLDNVGKEYVTDLLNLNNAYQGFRSIEMRSPRDLNELITSKRIQELPTPPPGKIYKIDEPNLRIILVNQ